MAHESSIGHAGRPQSATILIADDEVGPRESLRLILTPQYNVLSATNGREALELFHEHRPAVVISDIRMPFMNGVDLMKAVKDTSPETPVVLITGYSTVQTAQEAVRTGAFDYISKPYDIDQIRGVVVKALATSSEAKQAQKHLAALEQMNRELETRIAELGRQAAIGEVSAEMIHDLNNPISILRGYIQLLEDSLSSEECETNSEEREFLSIMSDQVERCMRLTQSFLNYARSSSGEWETVNINLSLEETLNALRGELKAHDVVVDKRLDLAVPPVSMQATPVQQLFYNLISNAVEAMGEDGGPAHLQVITALTPGAADGGHTGREIVVTIRDSGPGIPAEIQARIFEPFFTTKPPGKGTGLGLAICRRVVEEHGGRITVDSRPGAGTTFEILLPVLADGSLGVSAGAAAG